MVESLLIDAIRDSLKIKLAELSIEARGNGTIIWIKGSDSPPLPKFIFEIWLGSSGALVCEGSATVGYFPYFNPNFYRDLLAAVRLMVAPTPILHIREPKDTMVPSILVE